MNKVIFCLLVAPAVASAQIYRCDTPQGTVYSDERCGEDASLVTLSDESSGLGGGPSEEVRDYLARKRQERAEDQSQKPVFEPRRQQPDSALVQRIRELEQKRLQYLPAPSNTAEIARLERQIAELKAAGKTPAEAPEPQVWRIDDDE